MMKLLALILVLAMAGGGAAAGFLLRPTPDPEAETAPPPTEPLVEEAVTSFREGFVVPVLRDGRVWSHIVLKLGVSSDQTEEDVIVRREPLLRDGLTAALFLHGNLGGFDGDFTDPASLARLRERLDAVVRDRLDDPSAKVLIVSMARQSG